MRPGQVVYALALPSDASRERAPMRVPVRDLLAVLARLDAERRMVVDHVYDY